MANLVKKVEEDLIVTEEELNELLVERQEHDEMSLTHCKVSEYYS